MTNLHPTAQRAREIVREQHAAEVAGLRKQMRIWRVAGVLGLLNLVIWCLLLVAQQPEPGWRGIKDAPPLQRVQVITQAYLDKDGNWRSFDNGEIITAYLWKP